MQYHKFLVKDAIKKKVKVRKRASNIKIKAIQFWGSLVKSYSLVALSLLYQPIK